MFRRASGIQEKKEKWEARSFPVAYARVCKGGGERGRRKSLLFKMKLRIRSEIVFYIFSRHVTWKKNFQIVRDLFS